MTSLFPELRHVVAALSLIASFPGLSQAQTGANPSSIDFVNDPSTPSDSLGIRPPHLWSFDYVKLLWSDTGAVLTAPAHWNEIDLMYAAFAAAGIGAAASLDNRSPLEGLTNLQELISPETARPITSADGF